MVSPDKTLNTPTDAADIAVNSEKFRQELVDADVVIFQETYAPPQTGRAAHGSCVPSFARVVIASEARQSRQGNGRRHGNEIAASLRSSR